MAALPNYGVFDEKRHFLPGPGPAAVFELRGVPVALCVCEDVWGPQPAAQAKAAGAKLLIEEHGCDFLIMDDGFQSARLALDYALLVIDTTRGLGNGHTVPGGPVRAPIPVQMRYATALLKVGNGNAADAIVRMAARAAKPYFTASLKTVGMNELSGRRVLAFAGIADPTKFFRTVETLGAEIAATRSFGDHEHLSDDEIADLIAVAEREQLQIVTTSKDFVRLAGHHGRAQELAEKSKVIEVEMAFEDPQAPGLIIDRAIEACRARRLKEQSGL